MKACENCGWISMKEDDNFCYSDGGKLVERRVHSCGRELSLNDKFCPRCGKGVTPEQEARDAWMDERLREEIMQDHEQ